MVCFSVVIGKRRRVSYFRVCLKKKHEKDFGLWSEMVTGISFLAAFLSTKSSINV